VAGAIIPSWSHDGRWIYFSSLTTGRHEIWKVPGSGGKAVQVTRAGGYTAFESPDGQHLYYTRSAGKSKLCRSGLDGSEETEIAEDVIVRGFVLTSEQIFYLRQENNHGLATLRSLSLKTGRSAPITALTTALSLGLSVSPDRKYALYTQIDHEGSDLMLVDDFH
jgi:Tol biopolymer transport system component